jgi:hypothetical protein
MIGKSLATAVVLLLAFGAFWSDPLGDGYSIGFVFLLLAVVTWFKWEVIRSGFYVAKEESDLPIIRMASKTISGMGSPPLRRSSPSNS